MILVGVSGSSKCDWQIIAEDKTISRFSTQGLNPIFHTEEEIYKHISSIQELENKEIEVIYVYSAGCGSKSLQNVIIRAFSRAYPKSNYYVNHDIVATALATYEGEPSISCILGTGSNACYFDGDIVRQEVPALDYVLGDEGGGSNYGKQLLHAFLYKKLPEELSEDFKNEYQITKEMVLENVYMKPYPNVYLASFMKFIQKHKDHEYMQAMIQSGMRSFMEYYILPIPKYNILQTHFTGSIAHYFSNELQAVAKDLEINVGKIIKEPIDDLVKYHINKKYNKS